MTKQEQLNIINDAIKQTKINLKPLGFNLIFWSMVIISMSLFHYFFPKIVQYSYYSALIYWVSIPLLGMIYTTYYNIKSGIKIGYETHMQAQLLTAAGKDPSEHHAHGGSVHESAWPMAAPLAVLAVPSVLIGLLGTPWNSRFAGLLNPEEALEMAEQFSWGEFLPLAGASVAISVAGITLAVLAYALRRIDLGQLVAGRFPAVNAFLANKWYLDVVNDKLFVRGSRKLAREVLEVDAKVVDGVVNLTGLLTLGSGEGLKYLETGRAQFYALIVFAGVIGLVVLFGVIGGPIA